jgi:hypothetical protein
MIAVSRRRLYLASPALIATVGACPSSVLPRRQALTRSETMVVVIIISQIPEIALRSPRDAR